MTKTILTLTIFSLGLATACQTAAPVNTTNKTNTNVNSNTAVAVNANSNPVANTSPAATNVNSNANTTAKKKDHSHEHTAPHGGTLVVFGEEFAHVEMKLDKATGKLTIYTLDGEAEKGVAVEQADIEIEVKKPKAFTVKAVAVESTLSGSKKGAATEFEVTSDQLKGLDNFDAVVKSLKIKGKDHANVAFNFPKGNE